VKHKTIRGTVHLRNWSQYQRALIRRGSLTLWVSEEAVTTWHVGARPGWRGAPHIYSDTAMVCMAWLSAVYKLALRATQGLVVSGMPLLKTKVPVPDYTTLCRRRRTLEVSLPRRTRGEPLHGVVDATGIKVFGEGEWKVRGHGRAKRRAWRKLQIGVDAASGEIVAAAVTTFDCSDGQRLPDLVDQRGDNIAHVAGAGASDMREGYAAIHKRKAQAPIPPRRGARIWPRGTSIDPPLARDENLRCIRRSGGAAWQQKLGYHRRSKALDGGVSNQDPLR
jgi:Transposase DDE domain